MANEIQTKKFFVVGRHATDFGHIQVEVVGSANVTFALNKAEVIGQLTEIEQQAITASAEAVVMQNTPGVVAAAMPQWLNTSQLRWGVIVSVPGERQAGISKEWVTRWADDPDSNWAVEAAMKIAAEAVRFANGRAQVEHDQAFLKVTVDPVTPFVFDHIEWFEREPDTFIVSGAYLRQAAGAFAYTAGMVGMDIGGYELDSYVASVLAQSSDSQIWAKLFSLREKGRIWTIYTEGEGVRITLPDYTSSGLKPLSEIIGWVETQPFSTSFPLQVGAGEDDIRVILEQNPKTQVFVFFPTGGDNFKLESERTRLESVFARMGMKISPPKAFGSGMIYRR